jgi:hypothetical protein
MRRFGSRSIGLDEGEVILFSDYESDGPMWKGEGQRRVSQVVTFSESFAEPPSVRVWLTMWDISHTATSRVDISARDINSERFTIQFQTWGDTRVARVRAGWLALGTLQDDDHWEVDKP